MRSHYKCIVPRFPKAEIAVFLRFSDGKLEFQGMVKDESNIDHEKREGYQNIYNNVAYGDSGGPIMTEVIDKMGEKRHVLVAVIARGFGIRGLDKRELTLQPVKTKCIADGSKVTEEIVSWIKKVNSGDYSSGKKEFKKFIQLDSLST